VVEGLRVILELSGYAGVYVGLLGDEGFLFVGEGQELGEIGGEEMG